MFNLKDIFATLRFFVLCVLLFAPLTSHALPATDNHPALCDAAATFEDLVVDPSWVSGRGGRIVPFHSQCTECEDTRDQCFEMCASDPSPGSCAPKCAMAHAFCLMACQMGP